jgi:two-component system chemotaxis response regulator CheY
MPSQDATQEAVRRRFEAMGLQVEPMPGGRTVLARLRMQRVVFETTTSPIRIDEVTFASVGIDSAKCMRPRPLFQLPVLRVQDCRDATAIEARIHLAWQRHVEQLRRVEQRLRAFGSDFRAEAGRSHVSFALAGEDPEARGRMIDPNRVILPGRGPLSGIALRRAEDRVLRIDARIATGVDLEIAVSNRLEELVRLDARLTHHHRLQALEEALQVESRPTQDRRPAVLVVGPRISQERDCLESLRQRGYQVTAVPGEREAIATFDRCSPELVLADVKLGRSEGIDLIQSLRQVPGIEEVPVVLVDSHKREDRREAARRIGAAGYLVYPVDVSRIAEHLLRIVEEPKRRRFTRYPQRLPVHISGAHEPLLTNSIGRGGMFLATGEEMPTHTLRACRLGLPEIGANIRVEAEVIYRARTGNRAHPGVGLRFHSFPDADEPVFIEYLRNLHPQATLPSI